MAGERGWLLDVNSLDALGNKAVLRFSSLGYTDGDGNLYDPVLEQPTLFSVRANGLLIGSSSFGGSSGDIRLLNADGRLNYLADHAVDGRIFVLSLIDELGNITPTVKGSSVGFSFDGNKVSLLIRDRADALRLPHPKNVYGGTNILPDGVDGTPDDIKGSRRPRVYGKCRNVPATLVNTAKLIYEASDLPSATIIAVRDRGITLTNGGAYADLASLQSTAPAPGEFRAFQGYFRLGAPADGTVTADVNDSDSLLGDVFEKICSEARATIEPSDVAALNDAGDVGIYLSSDETTTSLLDRLASSAGGYWSHKGLPTDPDEVVSAPFESSATGEQWRLNGSSSIIIGDIDHLLLTGVSGNYASTPDSPENSIVSDIGVFAYIAADNWTPSQAQTIAAKWGSTGNRSYLLRLLPAGSLELVTSPDGTAEITAVSDTVPGVSAGNFRHIGAIRDVDNGAAGNETKFYVSTDGETWTQFGPTVTNSGSTSIFNGSSSLEIGSQESGSVQPFSGKIARVNFQPGIFVQPSASFEASDGVFDFVGTLSLKRLVSPPASTIVLYPYNIIKISRSSTGAGEKGLPVWKVDLGADRVELKQDDLAAGVSASDVARYSNEYRRAVAQSLAVRSRHILSPEIRYDTDLRSIVSAETEAARIQTLLGSRRDSVQLTARLGDDTIPSISIGSSVRVEVDRLGYNLGKDFLVLGYIIDARNSRVELQLWG